MASRRAADELIASGSVRVNRKRPPPTGMLIDPDRDEVTVDGREITPPARHIYVALNKPKGVIVSAADPGRRTTVFDLVSSAEAGSPRLFAVGRLDFESSGLIQIGRAHV